MSDYHVGHALRARSKAMIARGCPEEAIPRWPLNGWIDTGPSSYAFHEGCDWNFGKVLCTVELGNDGDATVTFPDGESVEVNIEGNSTPGEFRAAIEAASRKIRTPA